MFNGIFMDLLGQRGRDCKYMSIV